MPTELNKSRIYDGEGDRLMEESEQHAIDRIILLPDALPSKAPDPTPRQRIMWGQHLLEDLLTGRYRSLVCAVNAHDNSTGLSLNSRRCWAPANGTNRRSPQWPNNSAATTVIPSR